MKGLLVMLALALAFGGFIVWWSSAQLEADPGEYVALAFGKATDEKIQIDVAVSIAMPRREGPRVDDRTGAVYWQEWVDEHFDLRDDSDEKVRLLRSGYSELMSDREVGGSPEFYLTAKLKPNLHYTFDYIPVLAGGVQYRYDFIAPAEATPMERRHFAPYEPSGS
jgi:hypothetical protein